MPYGVQGTGHSYFTTFSLEHRKDTPQESSIVINKYIEIIDHVNVWIIIRISGRQFAINKSSVFYDL